MSVTLVFCFLITLVTWYGVIYGESVIETTPVTSFLISSFGTSGLLIASLFNFVPFFVCWFFWVTLSEKEKLKGLRERAYRFSSTFSIVFSVVIGFNLLNDVSVIFFRSTIFLRFLKIPLIIFPLVLGVVIRIILAEVQ